MIQAIGMVICAYVLFRAVELNIGKPKGAPQIVTAILSVLLFLFTLGGMLEIATTSAPRIP
jgi:hypothetical protein